MILKTKRFKFSLTLINEPDLVKLLLAVPGVILEVGCLVRLGEVILKIEIIPRS